MRTPSQQLTIDFWKFHHANPTIFELFRQFAEEMRSRGFQTYSARTVFHRIRWHVDVNTTDPTQSGFKIRDNLSKRYALYLERVDPSFKGFFNHTGETEGILGEEPPVGQEEPISQERADVLNQGWI